MSNVTAEAPVRANRAPTRPKAAAPAAPPNAQNENSKVARDELLHHAVGIASCLLSDIVNTDDFAANLGIAAARFIEVEKMAGDALYSDSAAEPDLVPDAVAIGEIILKLDGALQGLDKSPGPFVSVALRAHTLGACALGQLQAVMGALSQAPDTLEPLRALTTFAGARPHREQPRPPIRRGPDYEDSLAEATGATAVFGSNMPGYLLFDSKASLAEFVEKSAAQTACLNVILAYLVEKHCMPGTAPDGSFLADFASFVSDQVYEHQEAVGALLKAGGAA